MALVAVVSCVRKTHFGCILVFFLGHSSRRTGWRRLRADSDGEFREAVTEAAALHSRDDLFFRHIEPEPASEDPVE